MLLFCKPTPTEWPLADRVCVFAHSIDTSGRWPPDLRLLTLEDGLIVREQVYADERMSQVLWDARVGFNPLPASLRHGTGWHSRGFEKIWFNDKYLRNLVSDRGPFMGGKYALEQTI